MADASGKRNNAGNMAHTGTSSLLVIFVVAILAAFAAATLLLAENNDKMAQKLAENQNAYYDASNQSEALLAQVDEILEESFQNSRSEEDYYQKAEEQLKDLTAGEISVIIEENHRVSWTIPISEYQNLVTEIAIVYPSQADEGFYTITQWQSKSEDTGDYSGTLNLFNTKE